MNPLIIGIIVLFACLFLSIPTAASVGFAVVSIWLAMPSIATTPAYMYQAMVSALDSYVLLAVPLFILSGQIMARGGMAKKLYDCFSYFLGNIPGGLPCTVVVTCLFYGALSGSAPATVAAVGAMTIPLLVEMGYDKAFATALVCVAGGLGVIIPPSIPFVIYGQAVSASIGSMFIAGILPGLLIGVCLMAYSVFYCRRNTGNREKIEQNYRELRKKGFLNVFKDSFWALLTPIIILGGIYSGIFTPTEAACISVIYSLIISLFVYRSVSVKKLPGILFASTRTIGPQLYIVGVCTAFARALALLGATRQLTEWMTAAFSSKVGVLLFINFVLLVIGCLMDTTAAILVCAPLFYPIAAAVGVDIIHFGIIMVCNLAIGFVTPPVGANINISHAMTGVPILQIVKQALPFLLMFLVALAIITFVPMLSLILL